MGDWCEAYSILMFDIGVLSLLELESARAWESIDDPEASLSFASFIAWSFKPILLRAVVKFYSGQVEPPGILDGLIAYRLTTHLDGEASIFWWELIVFVEFYRNWDEFCGFGTGSGASSASLGFELLVMNYVSHCFPLSACSVTGSLTVCFWFLKWPS
jgi:hypothetical protein